MTECKSQRLWMLYLRLAEAGVSFALSDYREFFRGITSSFNVEACWMRGHRGSTWVSHHDVSGYQAIVLLVSVHQGGRQAFKYAHNTS